MKTVFEAAGGANGVRGRPGEVGMQDLPQGGIFLQAGIGQGLVEVRSPSASFLRRNPTKHRLSATLAGYSISGFALE
jgi:hypothetical protein